MCTLKKVNTRRANYSYMAFILLPLLLVQACNDTEQAQQTNAPAQSNSTVQTIHAKPSANATAERLNESVLQQISPLFLALLEETHKLSTATSLFIKTPTLEHLIQVNTTWRTSHTAYLHTRIARSLVADLKIVHTELDIPTHTDEVIHRNHLRIDQHPMLPGYLDTVKNYPLSGLIHSDIELSADQLNIEHQLGDEAYVSIGYHAIEFMIAGEDHSPEARHIDYQATQDKQHNEYVKRRFTYLEILNKLLIEDIEKLTQEWEPAGFYYNQLLEVSSRTLSQALARQAQVELEAIQEIRKVAQSKPNILIHDTQESLKLRENIATKLASITTDEF